MPPSARTPARRAAKLLLLGAGGIALLLAALGLGLGAGLGAGRAGEPAAPAAGALGSEPLPASLSSAAGRAVAAAPAAPVPPAPPVDQDEELPRAEAEDDPWASSERAFHAGFWRAAREQPGALEALAGGVLAGPGPDPEKVALLRVLFETRSERRAEFFLQAIRELPDVSRPQAESVPSFAVLFLSRQASRDRLARQVLAQVAFDSPSPAPELRRRSAAGLFLHAEPDELEALGARLARETDEQLLDSALEALSRNPHTQTSGAARRLLAEYGRSAAPRLEIAHEVD